MQANRICPDGGAVRVTLGTTTDNRGNGGTSLPCKGCWVCPEADNSAIAYINIGAAADADTGMQLSDSDTGGGPLFIPTDDVANLYFYGTDADIIDVLYLL